MSVFKQRTSLFVGVLVVFLTACVQECTAQAQPQITASGLFIVGREKTLGCYVTTAETVTGFPLTWSRGGTSLVASEENVVQVSGSVKNYNSFYRFTVQSSDNLAIFRCSANLPSGTTSSTWTVYVYKSPDQPIITGPTTVVSGTPNSWTCVVDGTSSTAPNVYWQFGNGSRLNTDTFNNVGEIYRDSNQLEIHKVTSSLTLTLATGAPNFELACYAVHFETQDQKSSRISVTVTYPPFIAGGNLTVTVTAGSTYTISCSVSANPAITSITWYKDGALLDVNNSGRYSGGTTTAPSLTITNILQADSGGYVCSASNGIGTTNGGVNALNVRYQPVVTSSQSQVGGVLGGDVTVSCVIDANPTHTTVLWYRINTDTGGETPINPVTNPNKYSGGTAATPGLTIKNLANSDAGLYRCKADNNVGRGEGPNVQVEVNYTPNVTVASTSYTRLATQPVTLECSYDANPQADVIRWTKDAQPIDVSGSNGKYSGSMLAIPSLTINDLQSRDSGIYVCIVQNSIGTGRSDDVTVTVNFLPTFNDTTPTTSVPNKGNTVVLKCRADANPPATTITWYKDGAPLSITGRYSGGTLNNPDLTITSLTGADSGSYFCRVGNSIGSGNGSTTDVDVQYPPEITPNNTEVVAREPNSAFIPCSHDANPPPSQVTWTKDDVILDITSGRYSGGTPGTSGLTILNVNPDDSGVYKCIVGNAKGNATSGGTPLKVTYPPKIDPNSVNNVSGNENHDLTLNCSVQAVPPLTSLVWLHDGDVMDLRNSLKYQRGTTDTPSLTILNLEKSDEGVYKCRATNDLGTTEGGNTTATINYKPQITVQPSVSSTQPNPATLTCSVDALPALTSLTWYKGGQVLDTSDSTRYSGGTTSTPSLTILSVQADDAGSYYCVASNSVGSTTGGTITLSVQYVPTFTIPSTQIGGRLGESATLALTVTANPAVTSLQWRKRGNGNNVYSNVNVAGSNKYSGGTFSNPSLTINNLDASDVGNYTLVATNALGETQSTDIVVAVSYSPTSPSVGNLQNNYKENDPVTLTCSSTGFPQPLYRWYRGSTPISDGATLVIASASPSDNTQFKCEAYNSLGTANTTVIVNVQYKPRAGSSVRNVTASIGETVNLVCATDSNPVPSSYVWFFDGQQVASTDPTSSQLSVTVTNSSDYGPYQCRATNVQGQSDPITIYLNPSGGGGGNTGGGRTGQSTEGDSGLPIATLVLIIIICLIILIVLILICIYCCTSVRARRCFKKVNNITPEQAVVPPPYIARTADKSNGHVAAATPVPNGRIDLAEDKTPNGIAPESHAYGLLISVPGGGTPRPHHLPPLGEEGPAQETESAREEKPKKKKRKKKRRHHDEEEGGGGGSPSRHQGYDNEAVEA